MPLHADSQKYHSFLTPHGIFQPTRTLQGAMNSVQNFQSRVEPCFSRMSTSLKAWLDDFAVYSKTEDALIDNLRDLFCYMSFQKVERFQL